MSIIIDFHTHAFPDKMALSAINALEKSGSVTASLDGKISSLITSMDKAGIDKSVICSIATKPSQFTPIFNWSEKIHSDRVTPFASCHPESANVISEIHQIKSAGFQGIKMHPYYQNFFIDEERMFPIYEKICHDKLILLMHTGFDLSFPEDQRASPSKIASIMQRFPELMLICSHLGAWKQWDEVDTLLIGQKIYMDISFSLHILSQEKAGDMLMRHPKEYLLFGSDSPWKGQQEAIKEIENLAIPSSLKNAILGENANRILSL